MIHEIDGLWSALENNHPEKFLPSEIVDIVAEVPGENDEFSWWWVLELKNKKYVLLSAWCDHTGWDCQSGIGCEELYITALRAAMAAPEKDEFDERAIRKNLVGQLTGKYPKFTYWGDA